jgi:hypothetical protein
VAITGDAWVHHVNGRSQTMLGRVPDVYEPLGRDLRHMLAKWAQLKTIAEWEPSRHVGTRARYTASGETSLQARTPNTSSGQPVMV